MNRYSICGAIGALTLTVWPAAASSARSETHPTSQLRERWPAEDLSGRITMVEPGKKLVFVTDSSGITFDFVVTPATRITDGAKRLTLMDLPSDSKRQVAVHYIPERKGDVASSIELRDQQ